MLQYNPATDTIVSIAQQRGSTAITRAGAMRWLQSHPVPTAATVRATPYYRGAYNLMYYKKMRWVRRVEANADATLSRYGYDPLDPNTPGRQAERVRNNEHWQAYYNEATQNVLIAQSERRPYALNGVVYRPANDENHSYNRYSRGWHRKHGPAVSVSNRRVERVTYTPEGGRVIEVIQPVSSYRGNWLINAVVADLGLTPIEYPKNLKCVQLNPHIMICLLRTIAGISIYRRSFAGAPVDYCVMNATGITYHADTIAACMQGLRRKLKPNNAGKSNIFDMAYALSLGFCSVGIRQFCTDYGLDSTRSYTRSELHAVVSANQTYHNKYRTELITAGLI